MTRKKSPNKPNEIRWWDRQVAFGVLQNGELETWLKNDVLFQRKQEEKQP